MIAFRAVCIAAAMTLAAGAALAQDPRETRARAVLEKAAAFQAEGELEQALSYYIKANEILPSYNTLWNIAQLQAELGMYAEARSTYRRYLEEGTEKVPVSRAARARREIERFDSMLGQLRIVFKPAGADVFVDDRKVGTTPLAGPLIMPVGPRDVVVKRGGKTVFRQVAEVSAGSLTEVAVKEGEIAGEGSGRGGGAGKGTGDDEEDEGGGGRVWTWVAVGVGGAALVAGGITGGVVMSKAGELEDGCPDQQCPESKWSTLDSAGDLAMATNVLLGVGAAAVLAGVILYFVEPDGSGESEVAVTPTAGADGAGVALMGRF